MNKPYITIIFIDKDKVKVNILLTNPTIKTIRSVDVLTGACITIDDKMYNSSFVPRHISTLLPGESLVFDYTDTQEMENLIWYWLDMFYQDSSKPIRYFATLPHGVAGIINLTDGKRVEITPRSGNETVKRYLKNILPQSNCITPNEGVECSHKEQ